LSVAGYSYYFGKDFNLSQRVEFVRRLIGKSFLKENLSQYIRASVTHSKWREIRSFFSKGIIPLEVVSFLTSLISRSYLENKDFSLCDLMASVRGDYRIFTKTNTYDDVDVERFALTATEFVIQDIERGISLNNLDNGLDRIQTMSRTYNFQVNDLFKMKKEDAYYAVEEITETFERLRDNFEHSKLVHNFNILYGFQNLENPPLLREALSLREELNRTLLHDSLLDKVIQPISAKAGYMAKLQLSLRLFESNKQQRGNWVL